MTNLQHFQFTDNDIRVVTIKGEPWFVAKDVCQVLGISKYRDALTRLDKDERGVAAVNTPGGKQNTTVISESGLYRLILSSRKLSTGKAKTALLSQIQDSKAILQALTDFEVPEDLPDLYVYAIRETETRRIKLGISRNPEARLKQLQTANSQRLELIGYRAATNRYADEKALHSANAELHIAGEWFSEGATLDCKIESPA